MWRPKEDKAVPAPDTGTPLERAQAAVDVADAAVGEAVWGLQLLEREGERLQRDHGQNPKLVAQYHAAMRDLEQLREVAREAHVALTAALEADAAAHPQPPPRLGRGW